MPNSPFLAPERDSAFKRGRPKGGDAVTYYTVPGVGTGQALTTLTTLADTDYYFPWTTQTPLIIDRLAAEVAAAAGTNFRIGLYAADADWQPVGAPLADSGNLSSASTGVKTYTPSSPIYIPRGRYVGVSNFDNTPSMRTWRSGLDAIIGTGVGSTGSAQGLTVGRTLAAFPTPGTAWTTLIASSGGLHHMVFYRVLTP